MNCAGQIGLAGGLLLAVSLVLVRRIRRPGRAERGAAPSHNVDRLERVG
jgi:hypothetical protein